MKSLYENPEYTTEVLELMQDMKFLQFQDPRTAYLWIVNKVTYITQHPEFTNKIQCGSIKNCSFCCHDTILMGKTESEYIKDLITTNKISFNKERVIKQNSSKKISWEDKACPMLQDLNENGQRLCSIYENRPLICRTHNNAKEPNTCNRKNNSKQGTVDVSTTYLGALSYSSYTLGIKAKLGDIPQLITMHTILKNLKP